MQDIDLYGWRFFVVWLLFFTKFVKLLKLNSYLPSFNTRFKKT
jgi:hypothetical protein